MVGEVETSDILDTLKSFLALTGLKEIRKNY